MCLSTTVAVSNDTSRSISLRLAAYLPSHSHSVSQIVRPWAENVEQESDGRIRFEKFWGGGLGRNPYKQFELVRHGISELAIVQPSYTPGQFPQLQILEMPFLTRTAMEASMAAWGLHERGLVDGFDEVKVIGMWTAEPGNIYTRAPIQRISDIKGLKVRGVGRTEGDFIDAIGAHAESMHPADVVEALRRGTIDGTIQGWISVNTFQTYRVTSHVITAPLGVVSFAILMNRQSWEALPPELQAIINRNSGMKVALIGGRAYDRRVVEVEKKLRDEKHLIFINPDTAELDKLASITKPLLANWIARTPKGQDVYDATLEILGNLRRKERMLR